MRETYYKFRKTVDKLLIAEKYYCVIIMLIMLVIAFCQVVLRYFFNNPWSWSDEIILVFLAWFAFPALTFNVWNDNHFYIGSVYDKFPSAVRKLADIARHILLGVFLGLLTYYGVILTNQYWSKSLPASGLPQGIKFVPVIIGPGISAVFCLVNLIGVFIGAEEEGGKEA